MAINVGDDEIRVLVLVRQRDLLDALAGVDWSRLSLFRS